MAAEKPQLSPAEKIFVRISLLQTVIAALGIFTALIALYAALNESDAVRKQLEASVWPHIELGTDRWSKESVARSSEWGGAEGPLFRFTISNSGIGPAKISAARVTIDGAARSTWGEVIAALTGRDDIQFGSSTLSRRVIQAGERINLVTLLGAPAEAVQESLTTAEGERRVDVEVCFCSVFDECWITSSQSEPSPVKKCPVYGDEQFQG